MAIQLNATYSKKLGLPGYSSHQFSVSMTTELTDLAQVPNECSRLYTLLQTSVDRELQATGFVPHQEPQGKATNGRTIQSGRHAPEGWSCTEKQRELIQRFVDENQVDENEVERLARARFGKPVRALNKLEASGLIDELIESRDSRPPAPSTSPMPHTRNGHANGNGNGHAPGRHHPARVA